MKVMAKHITDVSLITTRDQEMKTGLRPFPDDVQGFKYALPELVPGAFIQCIQDDIHVFERPHKVMHTVFKVLVGWCSVAVAII
jgi:hypothetical protein